ncbi:decarboxylating 6-phosphogluconate dehydrogenase [Candidatus Dependentiae bacterium]|nr:decarboxylating 6-phosphogluconate dehydrogenase [Candidatus Dependentiae bacterium]
MKIGLIGLGKMGQAIAYRLSKNNFEIIAFDPKVSQIDDVENISFESSLNDVTQKTNIIWVMVPAGDITDNVIKDLSKLLKPESIVIDGGNSNFENTKKRYSLLKEKNIHLLDCGTSGGIAGKINGYSLMIGGDKEIFENTKKIFKAIAAPNGFNYMGPSGAGHYVKMIHNGIEYSLLQSYAEGFDLLKNNSNYENLDLEKISDTWLHGSVIRSWILELCKSVFNQDQELKSISGSIGENQTGRWTLKEAEKENISMKLLKEALNIRTESRQTGGNFGTKVVAMLRNKFGGHEVKKLIKN